MYITSIQVHVRTTSKRENDARVIADNSETQNRYETRRDETGCSATTDPTMRSENGGAGAVTITSGKSAITWRGSRESELGRAGDASTGGMVTRCERGKEGCE